MARAIRLKHWCWLGAVVAVLLAAAGPAHGLVATPAFRTYGIDDGLPSATISDLAIDEAGHVWAATDDGLARFDGVGFRVWRFDPTDPASIRGNVVQTLLVDREDRLWVGVEDGGLSMMDRHRAGFDHFDASGDDTGLRTPHVFALAEAPDGAIWVGTYDGGLHRIDPSGTRLERWPAPGEHDPLPDPTVMSLRFDAAGWLWVGTRRGLVALPPARLDGDASARVYRFLPGVLIAALSPNEAGGVFVGSAAGLHHGQPAVAEAPPTVSLIPIDDGVLPNDATSIRGVVQDRGALWVATARGLLRRDPGGRWMRHVARPGLAFSPPGNWLWAIAKDREGGLWIGHRSVGLSYLGPLWRNFALYRSAQPLQDGEGDFAPLPAPCADGTLWLVRRAGALSRFDPGLPLATEFADSRGAVAAIGRIRAASCDAEGRLLIGYRGGLSVIARAGSVVAHFDEMNPATPEILRASVVSRIVPAPSGSVWLGLMGAGIARFDVESGALVPFPRGVNGPRSLDVEQIGFDGDSNPWIAGEAGLDRFDPARNAFVPVEGVPEGRIEAFAFGPSGDIHVHQIGTLLHARIDGRWLVPIRSWGPSDGLPVATMTGIIRDATNGLWLVSPRGLWRHDLGTGRMRAYGVADGLPVRVFALTPPAQNPDGVIFISSDHGVVAFHPDRLEDAGVPPRLVLEALHFRRDERRIDWEAGDGPVSLRHDDRELSIVVRTLALADPSANRYRFRLDGLDLDWVETGARGERVFPTLPPGQYTLAAAGANPQGLWSETIGPIDVRVAEPPWRTWQAYLAYGLVATLLLGLAFRLHRVRFLRRRALKMAEQGRIEAERQSQAKSEFLADVGHEIRTPMAGLLGMTDLMLRDGLEPGQRLRAEAIRRSGFDLLRLINDLLDLSRIEAGRFELETDAFDLVGLVEEVAALERPVAEARGLALDLVLDPAMHRHWVGDRLRIKQVLLNLVHNAIKFTDRGSVMIELGHGQAGGQRIVVRDTGRGITASEQAGLFRRYEQVGADRRAGAGLGLSIVRGLIERMGGRVGLRSEPGCGSEFTIDLDLPRAEGSRRGASVAALESSDAAEARIDGARVVVVEDDALIREFLVATIAGAGAEARGAANGLEALVMLGETGITAAVLDLDLPGLDGFGILAWIRGRGGAEASLPVLALTANSDPAVEARCRAAGFDAFLRKPVASSMLVMTLRGLISDRGGGHGA